MLEILYQDCVGARREKWKERRGDKEERERKINGEKVMGSE